MRRLGPSEKASGKLGRWDWIVLFLLSNFLSVFALAVVRCSCDLRCACGVACRCPKFWSPWSGILVGTLAFSLLVLASRYPRFGGASRRF